MAVFFLALAWLLGISVAALAGTEMGLLIIAASLFASITFAIRPRMGSLALAGLGALLVMSGGARYEATRPDINLPLATYNDGPEVRLRAVVTEEPDERASGVLYRLDVREVREGGRWVKIQGRVLMRGPTLPAYEYGDLIDVRGKLETPPVFPDFDYRDYLLRQGVSGIVSYPDVRILESGHGSALTAALIEVRGTLEERLATVLPQPEAALAAGILYGSRSAMPQDLKDDMNATGTSHLVAVSGQNVTIVAGIIIAALAWLIGRRPAAWVALVAIGGYVLLVGAEASVVRAGIMGAIFIGAILAGRQNTGWVALAVAAAAMTAAEPQVVHDVSFQLSFVATLGLVTLAGPLGENLAALVSRQPRIAGLPFSGGVLEAGTVALTAIIFTLPVVAVTFGRLSVVALPANIFAVPAFIAVAFTSAIATGVTLVVPEAAGLMAWLAWPPAAYMTTVIHVFAGVPLASIGLGGLMGTPLGVGRLTAGAVFAAAWYTGLAGLTLWLSRRRLEEPPAPVVGTTRPGIGFAIAATSVAGVAVFTGLLLAGRPDAGRLTVTFLDIGQGDAILIEGPEGHRVLVDGGPGEQVIGTALGRNVPFDDRRIDLVIATHPDADHLGGLPEVLARYDVRSVLMTEVEADTTFYQAWRGAMTATGLPAEAARRGDTIDLGGGARIDVLAPDEEDPLLQVREVNDTSVVLRISMGEVSFLLTGDLAEDGELALMRSGTGLDAAVLKVGHHGSRSSSTREFIARVNPIVDVISVGASNPYGHPAPEALARLAEDRVLRTDEDGDVEISTDGKRLWVSTQR
jgi:competence protein ComEC